MNEGIKNIESSIISEENQYLTFILSDSQFEVHITFIKEIMAFSDVRLTNMPMVPDFIRGILNLRGNVVPVIDLCRLFGIKQQTITQRTCIVILKVKFNSEETVVDILVDRVLQVINISTEQIEPPPSFGTEIHTDYIYGMGNLSELNQNEFIKIINISRVISEEEISVKKYNDLLTKTDLSS